MKTNIKKTKNFKGKTQAFILRCYLVTKAKPGFYLKQRQEIVRKSDNDNQRKPQNYQQRQ